MHKQFLDPLAFEPTLDQGKATPGNDVDFEIIWMETNITIQVLNVHVVMLLNNCCPHCFQVNEVTQLDDDSAVKFSSEVLFYVDKYEIVWWGRRGILCNVVIALLSEDGW